MLSVLNISKVSAEVSILSTFSNYQFCIHSWGIVPILSLIGRSLAPVTWAFNSSLSFLASAALYIIVFKMVFRERRFLCQITIQLEMLNGYFILDSDVNTASISLAIFARSLYAATLSCYHIKLDLISELLEISMYQSYIFWGWVLFRLRNYCVYLSYSSSSSPAGRHCLTGITIVQLVVRETRHWLHCSTKHLWQALKYFLALVSFQVSLSKILSFTWGFKIIASS